MDSPRKEEKKPSNNDINRVYNPPAPISGLRVNIGSGADYKEGFINVDKFDPTADMQGDILHLPFHDNRIAQVAAYEVLEHLSHDEILPALKEIHRILKPNGQFNGTVPDIVNACQRVIKDPEDDHALATIYGNQAGAGQFHKMGFTPKKLFHLFTWAGFRSIKTAYYSVAGTINPHQAIYFEVTK